MKSHTMTGSHIFSWSLTWYCIFGIIEQNELRRVKTAYVVSFLKEYLDILKMWRFKHNSLAGGGRGFINEIFLVGLQVHIKGIPLRMSLFHSLLSCPGAMGYPSSFPSWRCKRCQAAWRRREEMPCTVVNFEFWATWRLSPELCSALTVCVCSMYSGNVPYLLEGWEKKHKM